MNTKGNTIKSSKKWIERIMLLKVETKNRTIKFRYSKQKFYSCSHIDKRYAEMKLLLGVSKFELSIFLFQFFFQLLTVLSFRFIVNSPLKFHFLCLAFSRQFFLRAFINWTTWGKYVSETTVCKVVRKLIIKMDFRCQTDVNNRVKKVCLSRKIYFIFYFSIAHVYCNYPCRNCPTCPQVPIRSQSDFPHVAERGYMVWSGLEPHRIMIDKIIFKFCVVVVIL